ncbi:hypothetical protein ES705_48537 [subsurface metagenome]
MPYPSSGVINPFFTPSNMSALDASRSLGSTGGLTWASNILSRNSASAGEYRRSNSLVLASARVITSVLRPLSISALVSARCATTSSSSSLGMFINRRKSASSAPKPRSIRSSAASPLVIAPVFTPLYMSVLVRLRSLSTRSGSVDLTFICINSSSLSGSIPRSVSSVLTSSREIQPFDHLAIRSGKATYTLVHST